MKQISSNYPFFSKIFTFLWFGFLAYFVAKSAINGVYEENPLFLAFPFTISILSLFLFKKYIWNFVDEVYDCGDSLLIKKGGAEERVPISNIVSVNVILPTTHTRLRLTLKLRTPGKFGSEISFCPVTRFILNPFEKNTVVEDLISRVTKEGAKRVL